MNTILIIISVLLNCAAQLCMRQGMLLVGEVDAGNFIEKIIPMITNLWLWGAIGCFVGSVLLWFVVLSKVEVSYAYMFNSLGYVIVALGGYYLFHEDLSIMRIIGTLIICIGVIIMAQS